MHTHTFAQSHTFAIDDVGWKLHRRVKTRSPWLSQVVDKLEDIKTKCNHSGTTTSTTVTATSSATELVIKLCAKIKHGFFYPIIDTPKSVIVLCPDLTHETCLRRVWKLLHEFPVQPWMCNIMKFHICEILSQHIPAATRNWQKGPVHFFLHQII